MTQPPSLFTGGDFIVHTFEGLPPAVRALMEVADPPYRLCHVMMFWEYFFINGEQALLDMMRRVSRRIAE